MDFWLKFVIWENVFKLYKLRSPEKKLIKSTHYLRKKGKKEGIPTIEPEAMMSSVILKPILVILPK